MPGHMPRAGREENPAPSASVPVSADAAYSAWIQGHMPGNLARVRPALLALGRGSAAQELLPNDSLGGRKHRQGWQRRTPRSVFFRVRHPEVSYSARLQGHMPRNLGRVRPGRGRGRAQSPWIRLPAIPRESAGAYARAYAQGWQTSLARSCPPFAVSACAEDEKSWRPRGVVRSGPRSSLREQRPLRRPQARSWRLRRCLSKIWKLCKDLFCQQKTLASTRHGRARFCSAVKPFSLFAARLWPQLNWR